MVLTPAPEVRPRPATHELPPSVGSITDVPGIRVGHAQSEAGHTGCSVVLCDPGAVAGVDLGGSAPGTRETEMLNPTNMVMRMHAVLLTGGSTFGLTAAGGVQRWLAEHDVGYHAATGVVVPIVPTACIFDLDVGKPRIYPDAAMGYAACEGATDEAGELGAVGVGAGALVGKALGTDQAMRGGLGTCSTTLEGGVVVGALAVCNAWGDVIDPGDGRIVAGARAHGPAGGFLDTDDWLTRQHHLDTRHFGMNTTLCVIATNARFSREQVTKIAQMAQDGIARATRPSHTLFDGDAVFALSCGDVPADVTVVGATAARLAWKSIVRGVLAANALRPEIAEDAAPG